MPTSTRSAELPLWWAVVKDTTQGNERGTYLALARRIHGNVGSPTGRIMPHGDRAPVVVRGRESRPHWRRGAGVSTPSEGGGLRTARRQDRPGSHSRSWQTRIATAARVSTVVQSSVVPASLRTTRQE